MGRRAKKAPVQTKKRPTLAKRFKCPFCANDEVVECKMDFRAGIGSLACRLCAASYQMPIHHLNEPIDVFSEWLDDCEAAAQGRAPSSGLAGGTGSGGAGASGAGTQVPRYESDDDDDDDALPAPSGLSKETKQPKKQQQEGSPKKGNTKKSNAKASKPSYNDLGLGDSDDDSD